MTGVRLRAMREEDLDVLTAHATGELDPWNSFQIDASNRLHRRFADDGGVGEASGTLVVETTDAELIGSVTCQAFNMGISLFAEHRGRGHGSAAQRLLVDYLFATRLVERIEAATDSENLAEQRSLEKAGFSREGTLRHAQFRAGEWRDIILYSRLRSDPA